MPNEPEPFFTQAEWKGLMLFRPREWGEAWRSEPVITKILAAMGAAGIGLGVYVIFRGDPETGLAVMAPGGILLVIVIVLVPLAHILIASVRWLLRKVGVAAVWAQVRDKVLATGKVVFWSGVFVLIVVGLWPYLSLDLTKTWYALTNKVPVGQVEIEKKPHDCEFDTAPIGSKNCHYDSKILVLEGTESPDRKRSVFVSYEKVDD
jgi:hypothetical protein